MLNSKDFTVIVPSGATFALSPKESPGCDPGGIEESHDGDDDESNERGHESRSPRAEIFQAVLK